MRRIILYLNKCRQKCVNLEVGKQLCIWGQEFTYLVCPVVLGHANSMMWLSITTLLSHPTCR